MDLKNDPGETKNLAYDPAYKAILDQHRDMLRKFGEEQNDPLVAKLLENNVQPVPLMTTPN